MKKSEIDPPPSPPTKNSENRVFFSTDLLPKELDREVVFNGRWEVGLNAGGVQKGDFKNYAKNPQCFIELKSPNREDPESLCSAVISLMQRRQQAA